MHLAQEELKPKAIFFLGAGASIPAGVRGVVGLVEDFRRWLQQEGKSDYLDITDKILEVIAEKSRNRHNGDKPQADLEQLLDTTVFISIL